jgi:hypothetical protein
MHDNRLSKKNAKAPDFKCRDKKCDGVYWPGQAPGAAPAVAIATPTQKARIRELLAIADLADEKKAETLRQLYDTVKVLTESKATKLIEKLEKLAAPPAIDEGENAPAPGGVRPDGTIAPPGAQADAFAPNPKESRDVKEGEQRARPTPATSAAPATNSPSASGKATGAIADSAAAGTAAPSLTSVSKKIGEMLRHESLDDAERAAFRERLDKATTVDALQFLALDLENRIVLGF